MIAKRHTANNSLETIAKLFAIGMAFFIPLSNSLTTLFSILFLAPCLLGIDKQKLQILIKHPISKVILVIMLFYTFGLIYSIGTSEQAILALRKASRLLYIPLLLLLFNKAIWRRYVIYAYLAGVLVLVASKMLISQDILKDSIFTSLFVAYAIFVLAHYIFDDAKYKWLMVPLLILFVYQLMFLNVGRSGQILAFGLYVLFCWQRFGWNLKRQAVAVVLLMVSMTMVIMLPSSFASRQLVAVGELQDHIQGTTPSLADSSLGLRLTFAQNAIKVFKSKPVFGWGTGAFPQAYNQTFPHAQDTDENTDNPHNQYVLTMVELGIVGLAAILYLFFSLAREFWRSKDPDARLGLGLVCAIAVGCLANSWLLDFASMFFFVGLSGVLLGGTQSQIRR